MVINNNKTIFHKMIQHRHNIESVSEKYCRMSIIITDSNKEYRHGSSRGGDKTHKPTSARLVELWVK